MTMQRSGFTNFIQDTTDLVNDLGPIEGVKTSLILPDTTGCPTIAGIALEAHHLDALAGGAIAWADLPGLFANLDTDSVREYITTTI